MGTRKAIPYITNKSCQCNFVAQIEQMQDNDK